MQPNHYKYFSLKKSSLVLTTILQSFIILDFLAKQITNTIKILLQKK